MPSKSSLTGVNLEGYIPESQVTPPPPQALPEKPLLPTRSPMLRFSAPYLPGTFPSSDTLTGYHLGGMIPQNRIPVPAPAQAGGAGNVTENAVITSSSSTTITTNNAPLAATVALVTPSLDPNGQYTGVVNMAKSFALLSVSPSSPCRVELYSTLSALTTDAPRPTTQGPGFATQQGIICDLLLTTTPVVWQTEGVVGANADSPQSTNVYCLITNLSASSLSITVAFSYVPLQS